jgi:hypothetical protein
LCDNYEVEIDIIGDIKLSDEQIEFFEERRGYAGLRAKTPSRDYWEHGESTSSPPSRHSKQGYGMNEGFKKPKSDLPLASIGPVPTLIDIDLSEEGPAEVTPKTEGEHFSDNISEALFGLAPKKSLEEILALIAPESVMSHEAVLINEDQSSEDKALDLDSINESLSGIDDIGISEKKPEEEMRQPKGRYPSSRRRNYRGRRPHNRSGSAFDAEAKIQPNKNRHDGLSK